MPVKKFDHHLCLVSDQATPNLTPALDPDFRPKTVTLATSPQMQEKADWLSNVLSKHGILVAALQIPNPYDYSQCWLTIAEWLAAQNDHVALNVTGGTKLMAMAAQDVFRKAEKPVFYVNVDNDEVISLDPRSKTFTLPTQINLQQYLAAHGFKALQLEKPDIPESTRNFVSTLADKSMHQGNALGSLNYYAQKAKQTLTSPKLTQDLLNNKAFKTLISLFQKNHKLSIQHNKIVFPNEADRHFVNGGWLEYWVYCVLSDLSGELNITDWGINLEGQAPNGINHNELDAACLLKNTLHIIECKSSNLGAGTVGVEALYKLNSLRRMGGLRTKAMLIDYRGSLRSVDKSRAADLQLTVVSGAQLRDLRGTLRGWLTK
ncbi:Card1-like endonuclease domain-containing protein [Nitrosomonas sp. wSCUT-2]